MAGRLLASGQTFIVDAMKYYIETVTPSSGLYVGLMTNSSTPSESYQLPTNIAEISPVAGVGSGYERQLVPSGSWGTTAGNDPMLTGTAVSWTVSGIWEDVYGYFVSVTATGYNALWAEVFPAGKGGDKNDGDRIIVTPRYEQQYKGEA